PLVCVVARAENGQAALIQMDHVEIDVVILDLEMPVMDGMTALPLMLARRPGVKIIIASTLTLRNARLCLETLQAGATDYVSKPDGGMAQAHLFHRQLLDKVKAIGGVAVDRTPAAPVRRPPPPARVRSERPSVIAIGGSTGAPPVLI